MFIPQKLSRQPNKSSVLNAKGTLKGGVHMLARSLSAKSHHIESNSLQSLGSCGRLTALPSRAGSADVIMAKLK